MAGYEDFVHLNYRPKPTDLLVSFRVKVPSWEKPKRAFGAVASESSVGTWAGVAAIQYDHVQEVAAKVYSIEQHGSDAWIKIAYPQDHFEHDNMAQILASIAGNVFGMKAVDGLRLQDIRWPKAIVKKYPGPQFGIKGIRKIFDAQKRPLMLSVPKPKVGMTTAEHADIGYQIWSGGLDLLKDDENLSNQKFNPFERRVKASLKLRNKAEKITGEKKSYLINVTSGSTEEMIRRAKFVAKEGGEYVMVDVITSGWTAVRSLRNACDDLGLAMHAHRAMHGAFTRDQGHGFSMVAVSEIARLEGLDQLHVGTKIGKLVSPEEEVLELQDKLTLPVTKANPKHHYFEQDWYGKKSVFPVSSGGLHPGLIPEIMQIFGTTDVMLQIGGGIHGHPNGSHAGALAMRAAVEAYLDHETLEEKAKSVPALAVAMKTWGRSRPR